MDWAQSRDYDNRLGLKIAPEVKDPNNNGKTAKLK